MVPSPPDMSRPQRATGHGHRPAQIQQQAAPLFSALLIYVAARFQQHCRRVAVLVAPGRLAVMSPAERQSPAHAAHARSGRRLRAKAKAKALGAIFSPGMKRWIVTQGNDLGPFARWRQRHGSSGVPSSSRRALLRGGRPTVGEVDFGREGPVGSERGDACRKALSDLCIVNRLRPRRPAEISWH